MRNSKHLIFSFPSEFQEELEQKVVEDVLNDEIFIFLQLIQMKSSDFVRGVYYATTIWSFEFKLECIQNDTR